MATSATFKVSSVKVTRVTNSNAVDRIKDSTDRRSICSQLPAYERNHCSEVLMETQFSNSALPSRNNGFVRTVIACYNGHHNLVIRPDDIWIAILTQFSFYISRNAEEFRRQFVNFDGKRELSIQIFGTLRDAPYDFFVTELTDKIDQNLVDYTLKDWVLPKFTTTTVDDIMSCGIVLVATANKYFDLTCCLTCGIPYITVEGTIADWEDILNRLETLKSFKLDKWYDMLKPILEEFVAVKKNDENEEFWDGICHHLRGLSGSGYISGWLTAFASFDEDGNWADCFDAALWRFPTIKFEEKKWPIIEIGKIPSGSVNVNVKIIDDFGAHESIMFAGHIAYEVLEDDYTLQPKVGWGIALKSTTEEVKTFHKTASGLYIFLFL